MNLNQFCADSAKVQRFWSPVCYFRGEKVPVCSVCVCQGRCSAVCVCGGGGGGAGFDENEEGHSDNEEGHSNNEEGDSSFL